MATKKTTGGTKTTKAKKATAASKAPKPSVEVATTAPRTGLIMKNSTYDKLKFVAQILLPAIAALWATISAIWNLPLADQIEQTITAVVIFIDAILGITLAKASSDYHKGDA